MNNDSVNSDNEDSSGVDEVNDFYFESDHLALRGNRDYANVLRTIAVLEAQRVRVHQQLEDLALAKKRYLDDPEIFIQKLRNNEEIIAANYMTIAKLPEVGTYESLPQEDVKIKEEHMSSAEAVPAVRGRIVDETKPETFNRLWTCEEQRRLEQLLIDYPVEAIESRRFIKIAKALGNRTPQQVASRVQKYFKKLHDAGMPIPGRIPKNRRSGQTKTKHLYRPTTFFPAHNVPVYMPEEDFMLGDLRSNLHSPALDGGSTSAVGGDFDIDAQTPETPETQRRMLHMLSVIRDEKKTGTDGYNPDPLAAKCSTCELAPISNTRWRCNTCYCLLNQCTDCLASQLLSHKFEHISHDVVIESDT